eukprot:9702327-Alexandrium_andersonii.AAC.1
MLHAKAASFALADAHWERLLAPGARVQHAEDAAECLEAHLGLARLHAAEDANYVRYAAFALRSGDPSSTRDLGGPCGETLCPFSSHL